LQRAQDLDFGEGSATAAVRGKHLGDEAPEGDTGAENGLAAIDSFAFGFFVNAKDVIGNAPAEDIPESIKSKGAQQNALFVDRRCGSGRAPEENFVEIFKEGSEGKSSFQHKKY
jgi:hypothetical protein